MALETLKEQGTEGLGEIVFAATTSEEVGAEGAMYLLRTRPADICVALEIGPRSPDADFPIDAQPTLWVRDGYAAMESVDGDCSRTAAPNSARRPLAIPFARRQRRLLRLVQRLHGPPGHHRPARRKLARLRDHASDAPNELLRLLFSYLKKAK